MIKIKDEILLNNKLYIIESVNKDEILLNNNNILNWVSKSNLKKSLSKIDYNLDNIYKNNNKIVFENNNTKITIQPNNRIYYHGSNHNIKNEFNTSAIFWSTDLDFSENYGKWIYKANLIMNNTFDITNKGCFDELLDYEDGMLYETDYDDDFNKSGKKYYKSFDEFLLSKPHLNSWEITENYLYSIQSMGYDSIRVFEEGIENYAVFNNNQIKLLGKPVPRRLVENLNNKSTSVSIKLNEQLYTKQFNSDKYDTIVELSNTFKYYNEITQSKLINYGFVKESIVYTKTLKDDNGESFMFTIEKNPSKKEFWDLLKNSKRKKLRGIVGLEKFSNLYIWDAYYGTHTDMYNQHIKYRDDKLDKDGYIEIYFDENGINVQGLSKDIDRIKEKYYGKPKENNIVSDKMKAIFNDDDLGLLN